MPRIFFGFHVHLKRGHSASRQVVVWSPVVWWSRRGFQLALYKNQGSTPNPIHQSEPASHRYLSYLMLEADGYPLARAGRCLAPPSS